MSHQSLVEIIFDRSQVNKKIKKYHYRRLQEATHLFCVYVGNFQNIEN